VLSESQVYRMDHFLGKETVQNIMVLRFANGIFEPIWNRDHIDHVEITVAETVGVERRAKFYEATGALRDMVPNHVFQLLSLIAMAPPNSFAADAVRSETQGVKPYISTVGRRGTVRRTLRPVSLTGRSKAYRRSRVDPKHDRNIRCDALNIDNWVGCPLFPAYRQEAEPPQPRSRSSLSGRRSRCSATRLSMP
jgi:glucose-6-phosphate 1-dehydrogenase